MSPRPIEFPVEGLSDGFVRLRLMSEADIPAIVEAVQDSEIPRWTTVPNPYGADEARHWQRVASTGLESGTELPALIVDIEDGRLLSAAGLHNLDPASGRASAGYWVAAPERGRRVARRGLALLCAYAVRRARCAADRALDRALECALAAGRRSRRLPREGLLRSFMPIRGVRRDMLMYSLVPADLR